MWIKIILLTWKSCKNCQGDCKWMSLGLKNKLEEKNISNYQNTDKWFSHM